MFETATLATRRSFLTRAPLGAAALAGGAIAIPHLILPGTVSAEVGPPPPPPLRPIWIEDASTVALQQQVIAMAQSSIDNFSDGDWQNLGSILQTLGAQWALWGNCYRLDRGIALRATVPALSAPPSSPEALSWMLENGSAAMIGSHAQQFQSHMRATCGAFWIFGATLFGLVSVALAIVNFFFPPSIAGDGIVLEMIFAVLGIINGLAGLTCE
ncbi:MAG: hypothetical protein JO356_02775 [Acidobacteria bacterium]|nr:hypothetical protein [Acidobacteriota bacterium]